MQYSEVEARGRFFEQMFQENEQKYRAIVENAASMIAIVQDNALKYANQTLCRTLRYDFEEVTSPTFDAIGELVAPRFRELAKKNLQQRLRGETVSAYELNLLTRDGLKIPVIVKGKKIVYLGKTADLLIVIDITDHKRAEEALQESEKRFRHISSTFTDVAYSCLRTTDGSYSINWMTGTIERITGYSAEEIKTQHCWRFLVVDEDLPIFDKQVTGLPPGSTGSCELRLRHKNGRVVWVASFARCALEPGNPETLHLYGGLVDITRRKEMEEELGKHSKNLEELVDTRTGALRENEERMRLLTDALPVLISYVDAEQHYRFNNKAYEDWFQHSRNEVTGQHIKDVLGEAAYLEIQKCVEEALSGKRVTYESNVHYKNGGTRYILANYVPHFDEQGKVKGFYAIVNDITERRKLEEKLNERNGEIRAVNASIIEKLAQKTEQIDNISRLRDVLRKTPDTFTGLDLVLDGVMKDLQMDAGAVLVFDQKERVANVRAFKSRIEGIMLNESYPLDSRISECELPTLDKTVSKIEDKSCILGTTSIHCAPTYLGKKRHGSLILGTQKAITLDESDLTILRLYANLVSTAFEIDNLAITPAKEVVQDEKSRVEGKLEFGTAYLIKNEVDKAFEFFAQVVLSGLEGLCITREYPPKIRAKYGLKKTPVVWLTEEKAKGEITVYSLQDLSIMIGSFLAKANRGMVLLDGVEYLATNHGFESLIRFLQVNRNRFESLESVLVIPVTEGTISERELGLIERETKMLKISYR